MTDTLEIITRKGPVTQTTWDAACRTVEVKASGYADVQRYGYVERLSSEVSAWDLSRVSSPAGVPFLAAHNGYDLNAKLGRVLSVTVKRDGLYAKVQLSDNDRANALVRDLESGIGCGVSIGYAVDKWEVDTTGDVPVRTATRIRLLEVSAVSVAADPAAAVRSITPTNEVPQMNDTPAVREFGPEQRANLAQRAGLGGVFLRRHATSPEIEFRAAILDEMERRSDRTVLSPVVDPDNHSRAEIGETRAIADALMTRIDPRHKPADEARQFVGMTMVEIARRSLEAAGQRSYGTPSDVIARALHSTSDFPAILSDVLGKSLAAAYQPASAALKAVARQTTARDFKAKHHIALSEGAGLEKVNESGEFKRGSMKESRESYKLATYGKVFAITRQALVNDDLGAFSDLPTHLARTASALEAKTLAELVAANPQMADGKAVFHADHANLLNAAGLDVAALALARKTMRAQVGLTGELISVTPKYLVTGPEMETAAEQVLAAIAAAKTTDVNPFSGKLELVVEPRLAGKAWYLAAATGEVDGLEYCYLEGEEGPQIESRAGFDVDGMEVRVRLDFAAAFVDHRGWVKNPGQ